MPDWVFIGQLLRVNDMAFSHAQLKNLFRLKKKKKKKRYNAVAGDRTRVTRVTGGNTYHYTTTTSLFYCARNFNIN
jgi:hypothetical protein